jgi:hypothetical protein
VKPIDFAQSVLVDGVEVAGITIAGSTIRRGSGSLNDAAPPPSTAYLELIAYDAAGDLVLDFPGIGWRGGIRSGFVTEYEAEYEGVVSSLELGKPVEVRTTSPSGFVTEYVDDYLTGFESTRFVGTIAAIDYTPSLVAVTAIDDVEKLTRVDVDTSKFPAELELERVARIAGLAGVSIVTEGTSSVALVKGPDQLTWSTAYTELERVASNCDSVFYTRRDGQLVYRTHEAPTDSVVNVNPSATLLDTLKMTQELGVIVNRVTVSYGSSQEVTLEDSSSITTYGLRDVKLSTELSTLAEATAHGQRLLDHYSTPYWYMPSVDVSLSMARSAGDPYPDYFARLLDVDLDDELVIGPLLAGSPLDSYTSRVLGYTETLDPYAWELRYDLNPAGWTRKEQTR